MGEVVMLPHPLNFYLSDSGKNLKIKRANYNRKKVRLNEEND